MIEYNEQTARVPWSKFFQALNIRFKGIPKENVKGNIVLQRGLESSEAYFREMICSSQPHGDLEQGVSWEMFYKVWSYGLVPTASGIQPVLQLNMKSKNTFWEWFMGNMDYVAKFPCYWESG